MAEDITSSRSIDDELQSAVTSLRSAVSAVLAVVRWVLLAAASVGWIVFWSALARLHVLRGHAGGVVLSVVPILALVGYVLVRFWRGR